MLNKNFFFAVFTLIGMIVGAGIFAIPYVTAQAGFATGVFYLVVLTVVIILMHLFYGEIVLRTNSEHGLVGFAEKYLGRAGKKIVGVVIIFEFYGALLAYLIAGGQFLNIIFGKVLGGNNFIWSMVFFVFGSLLILLGLRMVALSEFLMTILMLVVATIFIAKGASLAHWQNLNGLDIKNFFLPYGVIFFSLSGGAAIPEIRQILRGQEKRLKSAILLGTIIPAIVYFLFMMSVIGVTGANTTKNAIDGLVPFFGRWAIILGAVFGFLAVITSYLVIGLNLRKIFHRDYRLDKVIAWFLVCFIPLIAFLLGINDFIFVIGLIGAVAVGLEGIMTILIYLNAKKKGDRQPEYSLKIGKIILTAMAMLFALGIIYQFIYLAK